MIITVQIEDVTLSVVTEEPANSKTITEIKEQTFELWKKVRSENEKENEDEDSIQIN
jgi:hypothetical protein